MMTFNEFRALHDAGTLDQDVTWRAYDIEMAVRPRHIKSALKALKMQYAGELAMSEFCARYDVAAEAAPTILGRWWVWSLLDRGRPIRVPLRSSLQPGPERASSTPPGPSLEPSA